MTALCVALWATASTAWADVPPPMPEGMKRIAHQLHVEGLGEHSGYVLVAWDPGKTLHSHRVFESERPRVTLNDGGRRGQLLSPRLWLLPRPAYDRWAATTSALVREQHEACSRGEGCSHISRFVPKYPPPSGAVDCGVPIDIQTTVPKDGPDGLVEAYQLTEASDSRCVLVRLAHVPPDPSKPPLPSPAPAPAPLPSEASTAPEAPQASAEQEPAAAQASEPGCAGCTHPGGPVPSLAGLMLALVFRGRARRAEWRRPP